MHQIEIKLTPGARLTGYLHEVSEELPAHDMRPCVVVCPGGGYRVCSAREKDPPALAFFAAGYQVFVLDYSVSEAAAGLRPLTELSKAVMAVRENAGQWHIIPDKIAVLGFSAGGHLAASLGTLWNSAELRAVLDTHGGANRPNAMALGYPVITAGEFENTQSIDFVAAGTNLPREWFALETHITAETPPTFLWHTADDTCVPVENTILMLNALQRAGISYECHIFPDGNHGLSMANKEVNAKNEACASWFSLCLRWMNDIFGFEI